MKTSKELWTPEQITKVVADEILYLYQLKSRGPTRLPTTLNQLGQRIAVNATVGWVEVGQTLADHNAELIKVREEAIKQLNSVANRQIFKIKQ